MSGGSSVATAALAVTVARPEPGLGPTVAVAVIDPTVCGGAATRARGPGLCEVQATCLELDLKVVEVLT